MSVFLTNTCSRLRLKYLGLIVILVFTQACHFGGNKGNGTKDFGTSPINTSFNLNHNDVQLVNGYAEESTAAETSSKIITQVWGEPKFADLNANGQQDAVLILRQDMGGSGTFYYLVVAIREGNQFNGSKGVLLGDRIQPQDIQVDKNRIIVKYLARLKSEPFSTTPATLKEHMVIYDAETQQLIPVEQNFEGEADPSIMTLEMQTWYWEKNQYNNDTVQKPKSPKVFSLKFTKNNTVLIGTDCNNMRGEYNVANTQIALTKMSSTRMYCQDSQEQEFAKMLRDVNSYFFTSKGQLILELKYDSGSMVFR